jgi:hypothetical protein
MKKIFIAVFCLGASMAWAQDGDETKAAEEEGIDLYISAIENIDVTAEKPMVEIVDDTETDLDAILDEAEALEEDDLNY